MESPTAASTVPRVLRSRQRVGLICGSGRFPVLVAEGARKAGLEVVILALRGLADPVLRHHADRFHWTAVPQLGQWIRILRRRGCRQVLLAGGVRHADMYARHRWLIMLRCLTDWTTVRLWYRQLVDKRPATVLTAVVDEFAKKGIVVQECTRYTRECLAGEGHLTGRKPTAAQLRDIEFGWNMARNLARLDIGQSVAVKEQNVIAVEAIEGTDRMIERAGQLCPAGAWCHIKVSRPNQDMRFDVPTIGPDTIENLHRCGAAVLCVEAGRTIILDRELVFQMAERYGITIVGRSAE